MAFRALPCAVASSNNGADSCLPAFPWPGLVPQHRRPSGWSCAFCWPLGVSCAGRPQDWGKSPGQPISQ